LYNKQFFAKKPLLTLNKIIDNIGVVGTIVNRPKVPRACRKKGKNIHIKGMKGMREMSKRRKDEGFTLIELMIVIAVIGILAVVLVPKVGSIKTAARTAGLDTNSRVVQAYVQSRITAWASDTTTFDQEAIASDIKAGLTSTSDKIQNPFVTDTAGTVIADDINGEDLSATDAIQIVASEADATGEGSIAVIVPSNITSGITINGLNQSGTIYSSTTINP